MKGLCKT